MPGAEYLFSKYTRHGDVTWEYSDCLTFVRTPTPERNKVAGGGGRKKEKQRKKEERKKVCIHIHTNMYTYMSQASCPVSPD